MKQEISAAYTYIDSETAEIELYLEVDGSLVTMNLSGPEFLKLISAALLPPFNLKKCFGWSRVRKNEEALTQKYKYLDADDEPSMALDFDD